ncbi:MAG: LOG family protein YvdD [Phycisphaerae bacterium]|nr:LOG family protein YvdD [Phycisphaerae bacterium]
MKSICVFCGSCTGNDPRFAEHAARLGTLLARRQLTLVYGGGSVGLMGRLADATLAAGGRAVGVIPHALWVREVGHSRLTENHVVETMHERKALMHDLSDAFVALPGALGTLDELFETWTWGLLGVHTKPFGLLNVAGYYDPLLEFLDSVVRQGFLRAEPRQMLLVDDDAERLVDLLATHRPPRVEKWITRQDV